jgi:hypothetical protein
MNLVVHYLKAEHQGNKADQLVLVNVTHLRQEPNGDFFIAADSGARGVPNVIKIEVYPS